MSQESYSCPKNRADVIDAYFLEHRAKLIDLAAFLDRVDRAKPESEEADCRMVAMKKALQVLLAPGPFRARRVQEVFSDYGRDLPDSTEGMKGAIGAPTGEKA